MRVKKCFRMSGAKQIGIVASQIYFPKCFIEQSDLEKHDGVSGTDKQKLTDHEARILGLAVKRQKRLFWHFGPKKILFSKNYWIHVLQSAI